MLRDAGARFGLRAPTRSPGSWEVSSPENPHGGGSIESMANGGSLAGPIIAGRRADVWQVRLESAYVRVRPLAGALPSGRTA
jgi:hypothetical protein